MASDGLIYIQVYDIGCDEMLNCPFPKTRIGELSSLPCCTSLVPVPWRRIKDRETGEMQDAPDPEWYARAQSDGVKNRVAQEDWYCSHPNLMAKSVVTPPPTP